MPRKGVVCRNHVWPKKPAAKGFGSGSSRCGCRPRWPWRPWRLEARMDALPVAGRQHRLAGLCRGRAAEKARRRAAGRQSVVKALRAAAASPSSGQIVLESKGHIIPAIRSWSAPR